MAHKTLIGGTAYEISGGKTLVDGTAYSIKNGKTLVGGTAYEVGFKGNFVLVYEIASYTPTTSVTNQIMGKEVYYASVQLTGFPTGYDKLNTLIVDGVEYEIVADVVNATACTYYFEDYGKGANAVSFLSVMRKTMTISVFDGNTHSVQIGYYE